MIRSSTVELPCLCLGQVPVENTQESCRSARKHSSPGETFLIPFWGASANIMFLALRSVSFWFIFIFKWTTAWWKPQVFPLQGLPLLLVTFSWGTMSITQKEQHFLEVRMLSQIQAEGAVLFCGGNQLEMWGGPSAHDKQGEEHPL